MRKKILAVVACVLAVAGVVSAEMVREIDIEFVTIGNAGNSDDAFTGYGAVDYNYRIGKYEVTNAQWNAFKVATGVPKGNPSYAYDESAYWSGSQQPTNMVSWYEATQFCNYLTSGDKSKGVYQFNGNNADPGIFLGINRDSAKAAYGMIFFLPTDNEWYKAAYYKPNGSGYSPYANGTSTAPSTSEACFARGPSSSPWNIGSGTVEQNGTCDMMGNVWEWNETLFNDSDSARALRGGSCDVGFVEGLIRYSRPPCSPGTENYNIGFRIASIPEPCTLLLLGLGGMLTRKRTRPFHLKP